MEKLNEFTEFRRKLNKSILQQGNLDIKRFFALDSRVYNSGALNSRTKEMLGLTASMVLRCDDCIAYHVAQCCKAGVSTEEFFEVFAVALVVGGSIVTPHLRRAVDLLEKIKTETTQR